GGHAVKDHGFTATAGCAWPCSEIKLDRLPGIAALRLQTETGSRLVAAVGHAILATRIPGHPVDHTVLAPVDILEQFGVAVIMAGAVRASGIGHEIARRFPAFHVARWN